MKGGLAASLLMVSAQALAQPAVYEIEPNDTPAEATAISGEATLMGTMAGPDQDAWQWSVSDADVGTRWTLELQGIPGRLTITEVIRVEYAENGVDVARKTTLLRFGSRDGSSPAVVDNLLFEPGDYILGIAHAGGAETTYRPPLATLDFGEQPSANLAPTAEPGGYRLKIRQGRRLVLEGSPKARPIRGEAHSVRLDRETGAYLETPDTWYEIQVSEEQAQQRWDLEGQVPVGRRVTATLWAADDSELATTVSDRRGKLALRDLVLEAGTYGLQLSGSEGGFVRVLTSTGVGQRVEGAEAEPNDSWNLANRVDLSRPVTGRMGTRGEDDYFRFPVDADAADRKLALRLEADPSDRFTFSLLDADGAVVQSRTAEGPIELADLVLSPGDWGIRVGRGPESAAYSVTLSDEGPIEPGVEAEPNDSIDRAAAVPANLRIKGRFSGRDTDFYKLVVTDDPQLWRFQVIGDGVQDLAYHDGAGIQSQDHNVRPGERRVRLDSLYLLPGIHHIRVGGVDGGSYTLLARPLGPPDPDAEREPNDDTTRMQPLAFGQTRTGVLQDLADGDYYRFHLAHWDRIRLTVTPPQDGAVKAHLYWDGISFKELREPMEGQSVELDGVFPPGDYRVELEAKTPSDAEYQLSLERLERFACPTDCEPNDNLDLANPLPDTHVVEGHVNDWRDTDWYALPMPATDTEITVASETRENIKVVPRGYSVRSFVEWDSSEQLWRGTIPAGVQSYLHVRTGGDNSYRLVVGLEGRAASPLAPPDPEFDLSLALETTEVGAYLRHGQRVAGELRLAGTGDSALELELEATTSDFRWRPELGSARLSLPRGAETTVPLTLWVPADAWADRPVRLSVVARSPDGAQQETFVELTASRDTPAVNPVRHWSLPDELRGGFNVAWDALGGRWTGKEDSAIGRGFPNLFDGMAVDKQGVFLRGGTETQIIQVTVELAGSEPLEVAGFTLNPLSGNHAKRYLKNVDIALSEDGRKFSQVVDSELAPIRDEQAFVLERPILARYARLSLEHAYDGAAKPQITLGEFKVITRPGSDLSGGRGFNLADPELGGHVVWTSPPTSAAGWETGVLRADDPPRVWRPKSRRQELVIGFHHDRAAQVSRVEWIDDNPQFTRVLLSASLESPVGPWEPIGELDLDGVDSTSVLHLDSPVWMRFLKLQAEREAESGTVAAPAQIRVWERPTDEEYRSILTEWGWASQAAIYEQLHPLQSELELRVSGNNSRATAQLLALATRVRGQVQLGHEEDWYGVVVPADENLLTLALGGEPTVRTIAQVENEAGDPIPIRKIQRASNPHLHMYEAVVEPGGTYYVKVEEPPRNVLFLWDTSASVGAFLPVIYNSLMAYVEDLVPGRDAANLLPFGSAKPLLRDWYGEPYILQTVLNDYPRSESSSAAEWTLARATRALAPRSGTKAIVVVTDAATTYYPRVWDEFQEVQPRVFGLGVSSSGALGRNPPHEQDLMQDWSRVNGGHYAHLESQGEMEIAFDRVATLLRRPAPYFLEVTSAFREAPGPGTLAVIASQETPAAASGAVELILDASGSMLQRLGGKRRIEVAREVLTEVVTRQLPPGTPLALRVFGHREAGSCRTDLEIPLGPLDADAAARVIASVNAKNLAKTPIADSLASVASDLEDASGRKVVVLVTDGEETCDGDPEAVIQQLREQGVDVRLNIVGFAIGDPELEHDFEGWAALGGGGYFPADSQEGLSTALAEAIAVPFTVYDSGGSAVAEGLVGGDRVELEAGYYRLVVDTTPPLIMDDVEVHGEEHVVVELEESP